MRERLEEFLFPARSSAWIALLRIGLGLQVTIFSLSLWLDWTYLFAADSGSLISRDLSEAILSLDSSFIPRLGWLVTLGGSMGLSEEVTLKLAWGCLLCSGICLLLGFLSRPAAIAAWFLHLAARSSGGLTAYGVDNFMTIGLFYLMLCPLPDLYSTDSWLWKRRPADPRRIGFHQRVLQLHLCLIYFFGGLAKCLGAGWWNGDSMWRSLTRSPFNVIPVDFLLRWSSLLPLLGIFICIVEIGYPAFIWPKRTRNIWLGCVLAMHAAIGVTMGMYLFALIMIVLNVAAFGATSTSILFRKNRRGPLRELGNKADGEEAPASV
jgi:Vitamin K-dependent gamma-carboxylase